MSMLLAVLAAAAPDQAMIANSPAAQPVIAVAPPAPPGPPIIVPPYITARSHPLPAPMLVDVAVSEEGRPLYRGTLRLGVGGASFSQSTSQSSAAVCPGSRAWDSFERNALNVQLSSREDGGARRISVSVNWQRPGPIAGCASNQRSVSLTDSAMLAPGQSVSFAGDGGLKVTLTRR